MKLNEVIYNNAVPVSGYGPGFFRVGETVVQGGLCVLPSGVSDWEGYAQIAPLQAAAQDIDVLLIGTGTETAHPPAAFREALEAAGIGIEPMSSPAACRTYNVLLGEGRRVGLAALPVR